MGIPIVSLENSTKTLWLYQQNLADAIESGRQELIDSRLDDLAMTASFSEYPSIREAATKSLEEYETTIAANRAIRKSRETSQRVVPFKAVATA